MRALIEDASGKTVFAFMIFGFAGYKWVRGEPMSEFQENLTMLVAAFYFGSTAVTEGIRRGRAQIAGEGRVMRDLLAEERERRAEGSR